MQAFTSYLKLEKNYSDHTVKAYGRDLDTFTSFCRDNYDETDIDAVGYPMIRSWIVSLSNEGVSNRSINRKISSLQAYYKFLLKIGEITASPLAKHRALKTEKKVEVPFSESEMELILTEIPFEEGFEGERDKLIVELLYATGMRRAELVNLKLTDIDLANHTLKVLGKRNKERIMPMLPTTVLQIKAYLELRAGLEHAHGFAGQAQVFVATLAYAALAAAMPGEDHVALADGDPLHGVAHGDDLAGDLVAHGQRQLQATVGHGQLLAMAQVVGAMPDVQVGMAHTRGLDAHQHLVAHRPGRGTLALDQGLAALDHVIADHLVSFGCHKGLTAQFMAVKAGCTATSHVRDTGHSPMTSDARSFPYRPWNFGFSTRSQRVLT